MNNPLILLVALALTGCATNYKQQPVSASAFDRDMYACERDAAPVQERGRNRQMIDRCMRVKGWQQDGYQWATFLPLGVAKRSN
jgi:hypothetical protein